MAPLPALRRAMLYVPASSPRYLAKSLTLTADNVTYDLEDSVHLAALSQHWETDTASNIGKSFGFTGKQCIHPSKLPIVERKFSPPGQVVAWATRVVLGAEEASVAGRGAFLLDGKMIDAPVVAQARAILVDAEQCGHAIDAVKGV